MSRNIEVVEETDIEIMEEDREFLFPGGPTMDEINSWKDKYGNVYLMEFEPGEVFLFRPITRREFKEMARIDDKDTMNREERVCEICVTWPHNFDFIAMNNSKAGIPTVLSEEIMVISGFNASNVVEL